MAEQGESSLGARGVGEREDDAGHPLLKRPTPEDVLTAAEELRAEEFPDIPAELLSRVLAAERYNLEDRTAALRAVSRVVDAYLSLDTADTRGPEDRP